MFRPWRDPWPGTVRELQKILAAASALQTVLLIAVWIALFRLSREGRDVDRDAKTERMAHAARVAGFAHGIEQAVADVRRVTMKAAAGVQQAERALVVLSDSARVAASFAGLRLGWRVSRAMAIAGGIRVAYRVLSARHPARRPGAESWDAGRPREMAHGK